MIGRPRVHHRLTDSTNERARELALAGAPHGTLVTADEQTAGRGRQGREWTAPPRLGAADVAASCASCATTLLPLAAAVAVCEALPLAALRIKWPNDVWIDGRKVAGILVEGRPQEGWAVLGHRPERGHARRFPPELRETATSLRARRAAAPTREAGARRAARAALDARWLEQRAGRGRCAAWRERDALLGAARSRWATAASPATGRAGIDDRRRAGRATPRGGRRSTLDAGEVHLGAA